MKNQLLLTLLEDIRKAGCFAIMADETRDISDVEQLVICIRWVDQKFSAHEDPLRFVSLPSTDAKLITDVVKDVLSCCMLPLTLCRGQAYDGVASMMGHLSGVANRLQDEELAAIAVHCLAHSVNLILQDITKLCRPVKMLWMWYMIVSSFTEIRLSAHCC